MSYCSVPGCVYKTLSHQQLEHVSFHKMPKENSKEWINAIGFEKNAAPKKVSVCSLHFESSCYSLHNACYSLDDAYRSFCDSISQPLTKRRYLNKGSVPTLQLPPKKDEFTNVLPCQASLRQRIVSLVDREREERKSILERDKSIEQNYRDKKQKLNEQQLSFAMTQSAANF